MPVCSYNPLHEMDSHHIGNQKLLRFPDGRKLDWRQVCADCLRMRYEWQEKRDIEQFAESERKRLWHAENAKRNEQRRLEIKNNGYARDMKRIAALENELEALRKKYSDRA